MLPARHDDDDDDPVSILSEKYITHVEKQNGHHFSIWPSHKIEKGGFSATRP